MHCTIISYIVLEIGLISHSGVTDWSDKSTRKPEPTHKKIKTIDTGSKKNVTGFDTKKHHLLFSLSVFIVQNCQGISK